MAIPDDPTGSHHDPLDAIIADYVQQVEAGAVPDREALLARHPELADRLREFFADFDRLDCQAGELLLSRESTEQAGDLPHVRYFGEYELLEVIARGGMGVVYKARQASLNRIVALKMILRGQLATPRDVARFRAEAEAAANLDHPHIVPIYEVGEHDGHQYYAMRYIEGTSLAREPRADPRSEARLLATVARAVHYAHQHGILHRDIKPSNILVAGEVPFITDFGLAKRLDHSRDLTMSGETPGTPRYMAPEQAAGRKDLTVAADVYSLGVVLYERLTGTTPFTGDDILSLLRQHREDTPPRPSVRCPGLDRDLETVCLKCLEKEPAKRYASADALADDLERWLRGEPILARPVGSLGRLRRWCRRNPTIAGLMGTVALALLAGTVTSTFFAVQADRRATEAKAAEANMEQAVVRSLVRPMNPDRNAALSPMELEALLELAGTSEPRQRLRFLAGMFGTEARASHLFNRTDEVVHSAVGLDPSLREQAQRLLLEQMRDPEKSLLHRTGIAWAVLELTDAGCSASQRESVTIIGQGWAAEKDYRVLAGWGERMLERVGDMVPAQAARLLTQALEKKSFADADYQIIDASWASRLAAGLAAVAGRLEPAEAGRILTQALEKERDAYARASLAAGLAAVAERLEPAEAARVCAAAARLLTQALEKETGADARQDLAAGLAAVAAVAERLEPTEAARIFAAAAHRLMQALEKETNADARHNWAEDLAAVAGRLEPAEAGRLLTQALEKELDADTCGSIAAGLATVAGRLEPAEAARVCAAAARLLTQALAKETDADARRSLAAGMAMVAGRLEPAEAARLCAEAARLLKQALEKETNAAARQSLAGGLVSMTGRLEPAEAARIGKEVLRSLLPRLNPDPRTIPTNNLQDVSSEFKVLAILLQTLDVESVQPLVLALSRQIVSAGDSYAEALELLLTDTTRLPVRRRTVALVAAVGSEAGGPLTGLPFLPVAREPLACRLTTPDLVELLKLPTCVRQVRRVVLDQLGNRYGRRFETHWDFVRYAQEQGLNLDFTTPPQRPPAFSPLSLGDDHGS